MVSIGLRKPWIPWMSRPGRRVEHREAVGQGLAVDDQRRADVVGPEPRHEADRHLVDVFERLDAGALSGTEVLAYEVRQVQAGECVVAAAQSRPGAGGDSRERLQVRAVEVDAEPHLDQPRPGIDLADD